MPPKATLTVTCAACRKRRVPMDRVEECPFCTRFLCEWCVAEGKDCGKHGADFEAIDE